MDNLAKRITVIVLAIVAALGTWLLVRLLGIEPEVTTTGGAPGSIGALDVALATVGTGVVAWAVHIWLVDRGARRWWPLIGTTALAISVAGPSWLADGASAVALICLHMVVGFVLI